MSFVNFSIFWSETSCKSKTFVVKYLKEFYENISSFMELHNLEIFLIFGHGKF